VSRQDQPHRAWPWPTVILAAPFAAAALLLVMHAFGKYLLAEQLTSDRSSNLFVALVGASSALLGLVIATLAILVAFPDRPAANTLRTFAGWRALQYCLLSTAFNLLVLLVDTVVGVSVDGFVARDVMVAFAVGSTLGLTISGLLFGLILLNLAVGESRTP